MRKCPTCGNTISADSDLSSRGRATAEADRRFGSGAERAPLQERVSARLDRLGVSSGRPIPEGVREQLRRRGFLREE